MSFTLSKATEQNKRHFLRTKNNLNIPKMSDGKVIVTSDGGRGGVSNKIKTINSIFQLEYTNTLRSA